MKATKKTPIPNNDDLFYSPYTTLSEPLFKKLSEFIYKEVGIKIQPIKKSMLESRLQKRIRILNFSSITKYCEYLFSPDGMKNELNQFIDVITTHKTDFFREPDHFNCLMDNVLPKILLQKNFGVKILKIWSAACSIGHEPYSIAITVCEFAEKNYQTNFDFQILATDISEAVLEEGRIGVYDHEQIKPIPLELRKKYLLKSKNKERNLVRIAPFLRNKILFEKLNLIDKDFKFKEEMDIVFCRNVMIYFDKNTQITVINHLCNHIKPGGYLFMGHSEVLDCRLFPLLSVAPAVYQKR